MTTQEVEEAALRLPVADREVLADKLWRSVQPASRDDIAEAWLQEAVRRLRDWREGKIVAVDGEQVMRELLAKYS